MAPFFPQRVFRWESQDFTLPVCEDIADFLKLKPLALEARFLAFKNNRRPIVSEKIRSCLCTLFVQYALAAERREGWPPHKRKEVVDNFKNSPEWDAVLRRHNVEVSSQRRNLPPTQSTKPKFPAQVPPQAPKGPAASRDQGLESRNRPDSSSLSQQLSTTAWSKLASGEQTGEARPKSQGPRPDNAFRGWEMPDPPSWELRDMTFQKFVDVFLEKNRIEPSRGYTPWSTVLSFFKDYVKQQWPLVSNGVALKHIAYALAHTKLKAQIPPDLLEKHIRRLDMEILEENRGNNAAARQAAGLGREVKVEPGKRLREDGSDSPESPNAKQIKLEPGSPKRLSDHSESGSALHPADGARPGRDIAGGLAKPRSTMPAGAQRIHTTTENGTAGSNLPAAAVGDRQVLNPTLSRTNEKSAAYTKESRQAPAPSPAASAAAWLQANIPSGPQGRQSNTPGLSDIANPLAALAVAPEETAYATASTVAPISQAPKVPNGMLAHGPALKSMVNLDIILNGVLEDLNAMVSKAREPGTTEALTSDQQNLLGKLIWSHKSALKELGSLQKIADSGWY